MAELAVTGLRNRYRRPGIGAPLAATLDADAGERGAAGSVWPRHAPAADAVARVRSAARADPLGAGLRARRAAPDASTWTRVEIDGPRGRRSRRSPPRRSPPGSASRASGSRSSAAFLGNLVGVRGSSGPRWRSRPYQRGRIPVVFVHGTASSPGRWADMVNDLIADARLRHRFAFWFFRYDSGNPIAYSAWQLRDALIAGRGAGRPGRLRPVPARHGRARPQPGRPAHQDDRHRLGRRLLARDQRQAVRGGASSLGRQGAARANVALREAAPLRAARDLPRDAPSRQLPGAGPQLVRRLAQRLVRLPSDVVRVGADLATLRPTGMRWRRPGRRPASTTCRPAIASSARSPRSR